MAKPTYRRILLKLSGVDLIVYGSCSNDEQVPNSASGVQVKLGAVNAASMDINTACTSFLYGLSSATAMVRTGAVRNALVIGVELISPYMDWSNLNVAVLFGDACAAVVLQATENKEGLLGEQLGCYADARHILRVRGMGCTYANRDVRYGDTLWDFDGQEIFKKAVKGMAIASDKVKKKCGLTPEQIDLVVPHQANLRITEAVAKHAGLPMEKVFLTVQRYGNMSAATVPVALVDALDEGRIRPGATILMPGFGGGLTLCSHLVKWGERVTPLGTTTTFLVMELMSGGTLEDRLGAAVARTLPLAVVREVVVGVLAGLEAAHRRGVVHRDLKPANVKRTPDHKVKVLDFGLAKAVASDPQGSSPGSTPTILPTITSLGTAAGMILGTAAYMSPEQARGKTVDKRADIFAFGCVVWEVLTGRQLFSGETVSDTLAAVLRAEVDWNALPKETPRAIVRLLHRCLEKDPKRRYA